MKRSLLILLGFLLLTFNSLCSQSEEDINFLRPPQNLKDIKIEYRRNIKGNFIEEALRRVSPKFTRLYNLRSHAPWAYGDLDPDYKRAPKAAIESFKDLKFGIRIHWGVYSMNGSNPSWSIWPLKGQLDHDDLANADYKEEWPKDDLLISERANPTPAYPTRGLSNDEYIEYTKKYCTFYQEFNPTGFNAEEWAKIFIRAGFKFAVLTSKHHDGFSMFDTMTKTTALRKINQNGNTKYEIVWLNYSIMDTPYKKDIVKQFVSAMRENGLAVGLYFSNPDWMDYYARFGACNLFRDSTYTIESDPEGYVRYAQRHREQLRDLTENYGTVDFLSLDHGLSIDLWDEFKTTLKIIRKNQPNIMIRHRGIGDWGDYFSPEGWHPDNYYDVRIHNRKPWTVIGSTGLHPGYSLPKDQKLEPIDSLIHKLIVIVSIGGNLQVGFGPGPDGKFDKAVVNYLEKIGDWLKINGEAIYSTRPRFIYKEGDSIRFTRSKDHSKIYAIALHWPGQKLILKSVNAVPESSINLLGYEKPLSWTQSDNELTIYIPEELQNENNRACKYAYAFRINTK